MIILADTIKEPRKVKIRKPHICQGCGKELKTGEIVTSSTYADSGEIYTFYECCECADHVAKVCRTCKDADMCICENYYVGLIKECIKEMER